MTDEAIKAALRAAVVAMQDALDPNGFAPPSWEDRAAAAIEAFLRALPGCDVGMQRYTPDGESDGPHSTVTLAAAVARAAKEPTQTCGGNTQSAAKEGGR